MKLVNNTEWSSRDLRRFITAGLKFKGADVAKTQVRVHYCAARGSNAGINGRAWVRSNHMELTLPKPTSHAVKHGLLDRYQLLRLAQVLEHEVDHTFGLLHHEMLDWWTLKLTWYLGLDIRVREPQRAAASPRRELRAAHAASMLAEWEAKLSRAEKRVTFWRKKVRYYERTTK